MAGRNPRAKLCDAYYSRYEKIGAEDVDFFNKSESYLRTIGERGRRERPFWVFALIFMLIMFEAVGFAYVLVPFINQNLSANDQSWMGWLFAFLLAVRLGDPGRSHRPCRAQERADQQGSPLVGKTTATATARISSRSCRASGSKTPKAIKTARTTTASWRALTPTTP